MDKKFIVNYEGSSPAFATQTEAEDKAKRCAYKNQDYKWIVYQAIAEARVPAPAIEIVAI
jgi:hypothetical protein